MSLPATEPPLLALSPRGGLFLVLVMGALVALPGLVMGIHADDWFQMRPRALGEVLATFGGDWNTGQRGAGGFYRPMVRVTFWLESQVAPLSAVLAHATNGILFLLLLAAVYTAGWQLAGGRPEAGLVAAAVPALHPAKTEALYWISGRTDLLAALFVVLAFVAAVESFRRPCRRWALAAVGLLLLGLLSKEVAIAGVPVLVLGALLLTKDPRRDARAWIVGGGAVASGIAYLAWRFAVLGGLGGYEAAPVAATSLLANVAIALGGLLPPGFPVVYTAVGGAILLVGGVGWWAFAGQGRAPLVALAAIVLTLLPMATIRISEHDGGRVLLTSLSFLGIFVGVLAGPGLAWRGAGALRAAVLAFVLLICVSSQISAVLPFVAAASPNRRVVDAAWEQLAEMPDGANAVLPIAGAPVFDRRILDPGDSLLMAMEARWLARTAGATSKTPPVDPEDPRLLTRLESPGRSITIASFLQPWMERAVVFEPQEDGSLATRRLRRTAHLHNLPSSGWAGVLALRALGPRSADGGPDLLSLPLANGTWVTWRVHHSGADGKPFDSSLWEDLHNGAHDVVVALFEEEN